MFVNRSFKRSQTQLKNKTAARGNAISHSANFQRAKPILLLFGFCLQQNSVPRCFCAASMMLINSHHMESVALIGQGLGMPLCGQTGQE